MPAALLGAVSCGRCGHHQAGRDSCERCRAPWLPARTADLPAGAGRPLAGVVAASAGRRRLGWLVDLTAPLILVGVAVAAGTGGSGRGTMVGALLVAAAVVGAVEVLALTVWGRSPGRWVLQQRTVDDLTGSPVRARELLALLLPGHRHDGLVTADLRRGRDPFEPQLTGALAGGFGAPEPVRDLAGSTGVTAPAPAEVAVAGSSVGIVLESGERYAVQHSLLVGRSPVDPVAGADRPVLAWPDLSRRLAKTHVLLEWSGTELWVTDLNSMTGTQVVTATGERRPLVPGVKTRTAVGSLLVCGGRSIKVVPHG